jgi:hypothetical protein
MSQEVALKKLKKEPRIDSKTVFYSTLALADWGRCLKIELFFMVFHCSENIPNFKTILLNFINTNQWYIPVKKKLAFWVL